MGRITPIDWKGRTAWHSAPPLVVPALPLDEQTSHGSVPARTPP